MKSLKQEFISITQSTLTDEEAIVKKMKFLQPKLLGIFCPVKYSLVDKRKVYIPYLLLTFSYHLKRGKQTSENSGKKGFFDKEGQIGIVFDMNEKHPFHFDLIEKLDFEKTSTTNGKILPDNCSEKEAETQSIEIIKWKLLRSVFHNFPNIELVSKIKFYRPAWELKVEAMGKSFTKYAYMDIYETENEHVSGLKVRLDT